MKLEDYSKYYIQGSDHYLVPKDIFVKLFNEMINWKQENEKLKKQLNELQKSQIFIDTGDMEERYGEELYQDYLEEENQQLKKQLDKANDELYTLKNKYNIRLLNQISENIEPDCEDYYLVEIEKKANKYDLIQTQQQEFIKYLKDESKKIYRDNGYRNKFCAEILQKYKEIIGVEEDGQ